MKLRTGIAVLSGVGLYPTLAFCAEGAEPAGGSWFALLFYVVNFAVFVWVVAHYLGPMARNFFSQRASSIRETLTTADTAFREAQKLAKQAAEQMAKIAAEKAKLAAELEAETVYQVKRIGELGREAAARVRHDAELTTAALVEAAQRRIRERLAAEAGGIARELIAGSFRAGDQGRLLGNFLEKLREEARR